MIFKHIVLIGTALLTLVWMIGCTTEICPDCTCPDALKNNTELDRGDPLIIHKINAGQEPAYFEESRGTDIGSLIDCGSAAYGPSVVDEIKKLNRDVQSLYITDTSQEHIGGCVDVAIEYPHIDVYVYGPIKNQELYNEFKRWISSNRLTHYEDGEYSLQYNSVSVDLDNLTYGRNEVYGE